MRFLLGRFFPFSTLNVSCHSLLACRVSAERSAVKHMGFPLYVTCCFSLADFNILSLYLVFVSLVSMCLGVFLLGFILYGTLCLLDLSDYFFYHSVEIFTTISLKMFPNPFFFSSYFATTIIRILVCLILSQRSLRLSSGIATVCSLSFLHNILWYGSL